MAIALVQHALYGSAPSILFPATGANILIVTGFGDVSNTSCFIEGATIRGVGSDPLNKIKQWIFSVPSGVTTAIFNGVASLTGIMLSEWSGGNIINLAAAPMFFGGCGNSTNQWGVNITPPGDNFLIHCSTISGGGIEPIVENGYQTLGSLTNCGSAYQIQTESNPTGSQFTGFVTSWSEILVLITPL